MRRRRLDGSTAALSGADADVMAWQAAVVVNGGTVSAARLAIVNTFVAAEKAAGTWALTDDYWGLWAESAIQALTSLKQRRLAAVVSAPTFTIDRDYTFDALTNYIGTGFIPGTNKVAMADANARIATYVRNNIGSTSFSAGIQQGSSRLTGIRNRTGTTVSTGGADCQTGTFTLPAADSRGFQSIGRGGPLASDVNSYKTGSLLVRAVDPTTFGALQTFELYIGALNSSGTPTFGSVGYQVGFVCIGATLSAAQELAQYNNVQAWATAVGANV